MRESLSMALIVVCSVATFFVLNKVVASSVFEIVLNADGHVACGSIFAECPRLGEFQYYLVYTFLACWVCDWSCSELPRVFGTSTVFAATHSPVQDEWMDIVKNLSASLNINRVVTMAEAAVSSPMVVGFVKPMVLFPVGLLAGLPVDRLRLYTCS